MMRCLLLLLALASPALAQSPADGLRIELAGDTPLTRRGREQLRHILATYDLSPWTFTRRIRIESYAVPHSHPVLTLNTRYLEDDFAQTATFLHEQMHWLLVQRESSTDSAMADVRRLYPDVPASPPQGAHDEESTYLHLLVCTLELDAVRAVFGDTVARRILGGWHHYTWVYQEVLERPEPLRAILRARGLELPSAAPRSP